MCTKRGSRSRHCASERLGFHRYGDDALGSLGLRARAPKLPFYLRPDGVQVQLLTSNGAGISVAVATPRVLARALGLLVSEDGRRLASNI